MSPRSARMFDAPAVACVQLHDARRGCFFCTATRA
ncbi:DUF1203 domain-containing protein [Luteimonas sp. SJ-16]|uniref:DUF1203 domain-containing protein n=1 Tax=Luteimonas deserti TaxID=2752306 RepID=A0A7Z0TTE7_9GAMM|nr:DUF1203 domain-containing protein [Luteimonas deserti]